MRKSRNGDITHLNDVEVLGSEVANSYPFFDSGDLLVSLRNINMVFVMDPETNKVEWYDISPFVRQHDPDFIGGGWIGIFDNNWGRKKEGSKIVAIQPHTDSTKIIFQPNHLNRFYTIHKGDWSKLKNGNMLLTESAAGRVVEVSSDGQLVWEWVHESYDSGPFNPYDSVVPAVPIARRYDLTRSEIASWSCSSIDSTDTSTRNR